MGYTKRENEFALRWAKRIKAYEYLGNECKSCKSKDMFTFCFHHRNSEDKENRIGLLVNGKRWEVVKNELDKCDLLCQNCHRELHQELKENELSRHIRNKNLILDFYGKNKCEKCDYDKCNHSLIFHHHSDSGKLFNISDVNKVLRSVGDITDEIETELNKCILICSNCHQKEHIDIKKVENLKEYILNKVRNHASPKKIDHDLVIRLRKQGRSYKEIMLEAGISSKGTLHYILNKYDMSTLKKENNSNDL